MKLRVVLVLLSGLVLCGCQLDCPSPNSTDIAHVISLIVQSGEASSDPVVSSTSFVEHSVNGKVSYEECQ